MSTEYYTCSVWAPQIFPFHLFGWVFPEPWAALLHEHTNQPSAECSGWTFYRMNVRTLCSAPGFFLSVLLSPLWHFALKTPAALDSQLRLLNPGRLLVSAWILLPCSKVIIGLNPLIPYLPNTGVLFVWCPMSWEILFHIFCLSC